MNNIDHEIARLYIQNPKLFTSEEVMNYIDDESCSSKKPEDIKILGLLRPDIPTYTALGFASKYKKMRIILAVLSRNDITKEEALEFAKKENNFLVWKNVLCRQDVSKTEALEIVKEIDSYSIWAAYFKRPDINEEDLPIIDFQNYKSLPIILSKPNYSLEEIILKEKENRSLKAITYNPNSSFKKILSNYTEYHDRDTLLMKICKMEDVPLEKIVPLIIKSNDQILGVYWYHITERIDFPEYFNNLEINDAISLAVTMNQEEVFKILISRMDIPIIFIIQFINKMNENDRYKYWPSLFSRKDYSPQMAMCNNRILDNNCWDAFISRQDAKEFLDNLPPENILEFMVNGSLSIQKYFLRKKSFWKYFKTLKPDILISYAKILHVDKLIEKVLEIDEVEEYLKN